MKNKKTALSLAEVLVATAIIAVAVYGMIMSITGQQMADGRMRDRKVLSQLHLQLVREVMKNQRNQWEVMGTPRRALDTGGAVIPLENPGLGNGVVAYMSGSYDAATKRIINTVWTKNTQTTPAITLSSSTVTVIVPYLGDWNAVQP